MTAWDRVQRQDLEIRELHVRVDALTRNILALQQEAAGTIDELIGQRDLARRVAMRLEEENALLASASPVCAVCLSVVTPVQVKGVTS